jgi:hypothetical protein
VRAREIETDTRAIDVACIVNDSGYRWIGTWLAGHRTTPKGSAWAIWPWIHWSTSSLVLSTSHTRYLQPGRLTARAPSAHSLAWGRARVAFSPKRRKSSPWAWGAGNEEGMGPDRRRIWNGWNDFEMVQHTEHVVTDSDACQVVKKSGCLTSNQEPG